MDKNLKVGEARSIKPSEIILIRVHPVGIPEIMLETIQLCTIQVREKI